MSCCVRYSACPSIILRQCLSFPPSKDKGRWSCHPGRRSSKRDRCEGMNCPASTLRNQCRRHLSMAPVPDGAQCSLVSLTIEPDGEVSVAAPRHGGRRCSHVVASTTPPVRPGKARSNPCYCCLGYSFPFGLDCRVPEGALLPK